MVTDSRGRECSFRHALIILTSNVGSSILYDAYRKHPDMQRDCAQHLALREQIQTAVRQTFRPELLSRLDAQILFDALNERALRQVVDIQMHKLTPLLSEMGLSVELTDAAKDVRCSVCVCLSIHLVMSVVWLVACACRHRLATGGASLIAGHSGTPVRGITIIAYSVCCLLHVCLLFVCRRRICLIRCRHSCCAVRCARAIASVSP